MSQSMVVETLTLECYSPRKLLSRKLIKYTIRLSKSFGLKQICKEIRIFEVGLLRSQRSSVFERLRTKSLPPEMKQ